MWGITALDQLYCRIAFRKARYDGPVTPISLDPSSPIPAMSAGYLVALAQRLVVHAPPVHLDPIGGAEVDDHPAALVAAQLGVAA